MFGFTGIISENKIKSNMIENTEKINFKNNIFFKHFNDKFKEDKLFFENNEFIICFDGVVLNSKQLKNKYVVNNNYELFYKMYRQLGIKFVKELRGNFAGFIYDKLKNKIYLYGNIFGTKFIYYFFDENRKTLIFSTNLKNICNLMKQNEYKVKLSTTGAYLLLTYEMMLDNYTLIENVKKMRPGCIIEYENAVIKEQNYYMINNEDYINDNEDKCASEMYERFKNSIKMAFDKDEEYGYNHIGLLSGGLDSRMNMFCAKQLGYNNITCLNFGDNNNNDFQIAQDIAKDLNLEFIFFSLANGNYLKNIEQCVDINSGQVSYMGLAHINQACKFIDWKKYGLLHNGNIADIMHGGYLTKPKHTSPNFHYWLSSTRFFHKVEKEIKNIARQYPNNELFTVYTRGIGCINGSIGIYNYCETSEPYLDYDVVEYCTKMNPKYKYEEYIFLKMINKYFPKATQYKWQQWMLRPTMKNYKIKTNKVLNLVHKVYKKVFIKNLGMNPYEKWFKDSNEMKTFILNYFKDNIDLLDNAELKKDCINQFRCGNCIEKLLVINLIESYKQLIL